MGQEYKRGRSGRGPCSELTGSKLRGDSWQMLVGLEVVLIFCKSGISEKSVSQSLSFIFLRVHA